MATVIRVLPKNLPKVLDRKHRRILRAIARGALRGAERGRAMIVRKTPTDQGQLKASWKVFPGSPGVLQGRPPMRARNIMLAELRNTAPHAGIVELGARPHKVSAEGWMAIYDWVVRHRKELGLVTKTGRARRVRKGKTAVDPRQENGGRGLDPEIAGITWGIVRKLERKGQKATYFVRSNLDDLQALVQAEVDRNFQIEGGGGSGKGGA